MWVRTRCAGRCFKPAGQSDRASRRTSPRTSSGQATPSESHAVGGTGYYLRVSASGRSPGAERWRWHPTSSSVSGRHSMTPTAATSSRILLITLAARSLPVTCGAEPLLKTNPPWVPLDTPAVGVPALEGSSDQGVRQVGLDAHPRGARQDPRGLARSATSGLSKSGSTATSARPRSRSGQHAADRDGPRPRALRPASTPAARTLKPFLLVRHGLPTCRGHPCGALLALFVEVTGGFIHLIHDSTAVRCDGQQRPGVRTQGPERNHDRRAVSC